MARTAAVGQDSRWSLAPAASYLLNGIRLTPLLPKIVSKSWEPAGEKIVKDNNRQIVFTRHGQPDHGKTIQPISCTSPPWAQRNLPQQLAAANFGREGLCPP